MKNQKGFTLIELLVVVAIIGILSGIAFVSISGARESAYDTQIRSELSQIRSNAEQYYYGSGDGSYQGYHESTGWENVQGEIPGCSISMLSDESGYQSESAHNPDGGETYETYQLFIEGATESNPEGSDHAQSYAAWAPLCGEEYQDADDNTYDVFYCVDSDGNAGEYYYDGGINNDESNCNDVFGEDNEI